MSGAKHTPGPWDCLIEGVEQQGGDSHTISAGEHFATVAMVPISSDASTDGEEGQTIITESEAIANARLIAAAPTTAEKSMAFTLLVEAFLRPDAAPESMRNVSEAELAAAMYELRAHLARATGSAP